MKTLHAIFPAMSQIRPELNDDERAIYEWQMWIPGFDTAGQRKLKSASLLISRAAKTARCAAAEPERSRQLQSREPRRGCDVAVAATHAAAGQISPASAGSV